MPELLRTRGSEASLCPSPAVVGSCLATCEAQHRAATTTIITVANRPLEGSLGDVSCCAPR